VSEEKTASQQDSTKTHDNDNGHNIENLDELRAKAAERDAFKDLAQRTRAEFENYQKRNNREREQER
jgi:molecular chaperone GrpE (heat shock protein)